MNKVSNINLGGYPFTIDEEAYDYLRQYLDAIRRHFRGVEGNEEITSDIETRLAELFQENLGNRPIVNLKDVKDAIALMGAPEDFGAEPLSEDPKDGFKIKTGKRLFRNPEDQHVGGVCSGIAAYLGIQDPLWVRLFFVVVALSGGFGVPLYIILWAIMPVPKTAGDWLAMRGEPINFSNIGRIIQEGVENLSGKISELGEELGGTKKKSDPNVKNSFKEGAESVGNAINGLIKALQYIWKPALYIIGFCLIVLFAAAWISAATGAVFAYPFLNYYLLPGQTGLAILGFVNVFLLFGIPLVSLVLMISLLLFGTRIAKGWSTGLGIMWGLSIAGFFLLGSLLVRQISTEGQSFTNAGTFAGDTLRIATIGENEDFKTWYNIDNEVLIVDDKLMVRNVHFSIVKGKGKNFELVQENNARGTDTQEANSLATAAAANAFFEGDQLKISRYFTLNRGQKWRVQNVNFILKVPEGKFVQLEESATWMIQDIELADDHDSEFWENPNQAWKMTAAGLACADCPKDADGDAFSFEDFNALDISGKLKVVIEQGDEYNVELTGAGLEKVAITKVDERLIVAGNAENTGSPLRLHITMPELKSININASDDIQIKGFTDQLQVNASGSGYEVKVYGNVSTLNLKQEGANKIDVIGNCDLLNAELSAGARLDAEKPGVREASVIARVDSRVDIEVREKLKQQKDESSRIRVKGNPTIEEVQ